MSCSPFRSLSFTLAVALLASACGGDLANIPTTPTPDPVTETFSGTLTVNGAATHTFPSNTAGNVTAALTSLDPSEGTVIGFSLGVWNGGSCTTVTANDAAAQNSVIIGTATQAGQLCVRVYDVGRLVEPVAYELSVTHP